jgi:hypothetical protein
VRILTVGIDVDLLTTRQALIISRGYDSVIALLAKLSGGTRLLVLETLMWPNDLLRMVAEALE